MLSAKYIKEGKSSMKTSLEMTKPSMSFMFLHEISTSLNRKMTILLQLVDERNAPKPSPRTAHLFRGHVLLFHCQPALHRYRQIFRLIDFNAVARRSTYLVGVS